MYFIKKKFPKVIGLPGLVLENSGKVPENIFRSKLSPARRMDVIKAILRERWDGKVWRHDLGSKGISPWPTMEQPTSLRNEKIKLYKPALKMET
jgi:hypothetical protein